MVWTRAPSMRRTICPSHDEAMYLGMKFGVRTYFELGDRKSEACDETKYRSWVCVVILCCVCLMCPCAHTPPVRMPCRLHKGQFKHTPKAGDDTCVKITARFKTTMNKAPVVPTTKNPFAAQSIIFKHHRRSFWRYYSSRALRFRDTMKKTSGFYK